jgi:hypothetical protein
LLLSFHLAFLRRESWGACDSARRAASGARLLKHGTQVEFVLVLAGSIEIILDADRVLLGEDAPPGSPERSRTAGRTDRRAGRAALDHDAGEPLSPVLDQRSCTESRSA